VRTGQLEHHEAEINRTTAVREALFAIMEAFEGAPRNRYGKVLPTATQQNALRRLAARYGVGGCEDVIEQAVKVAREALRAAR
jgi:hypothetical protein